MNQIHLSFQLINLHLVQQTHNNASSFLFIFLHFDQELFDRAKRWVPGGSCGARERERVCVYGTFLFKNWI